MDRYSGAVILNFLREAVCETGKAAHPPPHCKIRAFDIARADVFRIGVANDRLALAADAVSRAGLEAF